MLWGQGVGDPKSLILLWPPIFYSSIYPMMCHHWTNINWGLSPMLVSYAAAKIWIKSSCTTRKLIWPKNPLFSRKDWANIGPDCLADKQPEIVTLQVHAFTCGHTAPLHSGYGPPSSLQRINIKPIFFHLCLINGNTSQRINFFKILIVTELLSCFAMI